MEFLRLLLRRRFARAQVVTSRNVGCFLREGAAPTFQYTRCMFIHKQINNCCVCILKKQTNKCTHSVNHTAVAYQEKEMSKADLLLGESEIKEIKM